MSKPDPAGVKAESGAGAVLAVLGAYVLFRWAAAVIRLPERTPAWVLGVVFVITAAASIGLPIGGIGALVRWRMRRPAIGILIVTAAGALLVLGLQPRALQALPAAAPLAGGLQDLGKILAAAGVGLALA